MSQEDTKSEFRAVHAAREMLAIYIKSDRNIDLIKNIPLNTIDRYDVWLCVFEKEPAAFKVLQEKELYQQLLKYEKDDVESNKMAAMLYVQTLTQFFEWKSPITVEDALKIIIDCRGIQFLKFLKVEAKHRLNRRIEIVSKYNKNYQDDAWVGYANEVHNIIRNFG